MDQSTPDSNQLRWLHWLLPVIALFPAVGLIAALHVEGSLVEDELLTPACLLIVAGIGWFLWTRLNKQKPAAPTSKDVWVSHSLGLGVLLYLGSSAVIEIDFEYFYYVVNSFIGPDARKVHLEHLPRVVPILCVAAAFLSFLPALLPHALPRRIMRGFWGLTLGLLCLLAATWFATSFWQATGGQPIYQDDHPSFMQRLWIFPQTFPQLLYWDPNWNAGGGINNGIQSYLVSSGTTAPGLLGYPFWAAGAPPATMENYIPGLIWIYLVVFPLVFIAASRMAGIGWAGTFAAGVIGLTATRETYLWLLNYGTLGFTICMPFLVLAAACLYRTLYLGKPRWWVGVTLVLAGFFYLCWPAGILMALGLPLAVLASAKQLTKTKLYFLGSCILALWILMLPFLIAVFAHSQVGALGDIEKESAALIPLLREGLWRANPLVLFFGLIGVFFLSKSFAWFWGILIATTFLIFSAGGILLPQYELQRAVIPLLFLCVIPAAAWFQRLVNIASDRIATAALPLAFMLALMGLGVYHCQAHWANRSLEWFLHRELNEHHADHLNGIRLAYLDDFVEWSTAPDTKDGRIMIVNRAGSIFGRGHAAYLPIWCKREFVGCDFYEFPPALSPPHMPPADIQALGPTGWMFWCRLYNIRYIVIYDNHDDTAAQLAALRHPDNAHLFQKVFQFGTPGRRFHIFEVLHKDDPTWCRAGTADVQAGINRITVTLNNPQDSAVLRYRMTPGMRSLNPHVAIEGQTVTFGIGPEAVPIEEFILIDPGPENTSKVVEIEFKKWF